MKIMIIAASLLLTAPLYATKKTKAKPVVAAKKVKKKNPMVTIKTNKGEIDLELFATKAPKTVENFLSYVKSGHYKGTIFHRVIDNFMIQGGGFTSNLQLKKTQKPIQNEARADLGNDTGTVAMARTNDPHSATAQFFINVKDNSFLNFSAPTQRGYGYAVFGKVKKGMTVVNSIKKVATKKNGPHGNMPVENIIIKDIVVKK